jgi:hypothetical protein
MTDLKDLFSRNLTQSMKSVEWLERSINKVKDKSLTVPIDPDTADAFETLTSRFSRSTDLLTTRLWRSLDIYELEERGTLIDAVNKAHKRQIISDPNIIRRARELRNQFAHEYEDDKLILLWAEILRLAPEVCSAIRATLAYAKSRGYEPK